MGRRFCGRALGAVLMIGWIAGCANSPDDSTDSVGPLVGGKTAPPSSPCKNPAPDVLLCADFDDGSVAPMIAASFGGGSVEPSAANAVSMPNSLHVKTVIADEAAAALLMSKAPITQPQILLDADLLIIPATSDGSGGDSDSSLLRVNLMDESATRGAFFVHYAKNTREVMLVAQSDSAGDLDAHSLGVAPDGFFHITVLVSPAPGGGVFAQAQLGSGYPKTVSVPGAVDDPFVYTVEAGLDVPAADLYEAYLDNIVVRDATSQPSP